MMAEVGRLTFLNLKGKRPNDLMRLAIAPTLTSSCCDIEHACRSDNSPVCSRPYAGGRTVNVFADIGERRGDDQVQQMAKGTPVLA